MSNSLFSADEALHDTTVSTELAEKIYLPPPPPQSPSPPPQSPSSPPQSPSSSFEELVFRSLDIISKQISSLQPSVDRIESMVFKKKPIPTASTVFVPAAFTVASTESVPTASTLSVPAAFTTASTSSDPAPSTVSDSTAASTASDPTAAFTASDSTAAFTASDSTAAFTASDSTAVFNSIQPIDITSLYSSGPFLPMLTESSTTTCTINTADISESTRAKTVDVSRCVGFIKREMNNMFTMEELATSRAKATTRKYKGSVKQMKALSPRRLGLILGRARKNFRDEYDSIKSLNEVVNGKCRKATNRFKT